MSLVADWRPTFPEPAPPHWVCFTALVAGVRVISDEPLGGEGRTWLRQWLESHTPDEFDVEASYVYLGLALDWSAQAPDGQVSPDSVTGVGSGSDFGAPPGAVSSTVGDIWRSAIEVLGRGDAP
jgi:hypothetical protein